jgi:hypothetical protein
MYVCVCVCVCVYIKCIYVCMYIYIYIMYVCVYVYIFTQTFLNTAISASRRNPVQNEAQQLPARPGSHMCGGGRQHHSHLYNGHSAQSNSDGGLVLLTGSTPQLRVLQTCPMP